MEDWERYADPHFDELVKQLRPTLFLDRLRASNLINREDYSKLMSENSEENRSRKLLNDILPRAGKSSLDTFCKLLLRVEGQKHIVTEIICWPEGGATDNTQSQEQTLRARQSTRSQRRKWPEHSAESRSPCKQHKTEDTSKGATFWFKSENEAEVRPTECSVRQLCFQCFKIPEEQVEFLFDEKPGLGHPFYGDLKNKLAVLQVYGVDPALVEKHKSRLVNWLAEFLNTSPSRIHFLEVLEGSSFIVLRLDIDVYIALLCEFGVAKRRAELHSQLQKVLPGLEEAVFVLGGLPPLRLISDSRDGEFEMMKSPVSMDLKSQGNKCLLPLFRVMHKLSYSSACSSIHPSVCRSSIQPLISLFTSATSSISCTILASSLYIQKCLIEDKTLFTYNYLRLILQRPWIETVSVHAFSSSDLSSIRHCVDTSCYQTCTA